MIDNVPAPKVDIPPAKVVQSVSVGNTLRARKKKVAEVQSLKKVMKTRLKQLDMGLR